MWIEQYMFLPDFIVFANNAVSELRNSVLKTKVLLTLSEISRNHFSDCQNPFIEHPPFGRLMYVESYFKLLSLRTSVNFDNIKPK